MDSLENALALTQLPSVNALLPELTSELRATISLLLPRTPLLQLLSDLESLTDDNEEPRQTQTMQNLGRAAIARHDYARQLFVLLGSAIAMLTIEEAAASLADLRADDARLALQMLHFAAWLLTDAQLPDKAEFSLRIALSITSQFDLTYNRGVVLHELGLFQEKRGHLSAAETALEEASALFAQTAPRLARVNNLARARVYLRRLSFEDNPPQPADFDTVLDSDPELGRIVLPALARKALDRDDFSEAERMLVRLRAGLESGMPAPTAILLVEARLARRKARFEAAQLLLAQAANAEDADNHREELLQQQLYLARDLGRDNEAREALASLRTIRPSAWLLYQEALVHWKSGDTEQVERLLRQCLDCSSDHTVRADCLGMLGMCVDSRSEGTSYLYAAIGLYLELDRKLDHAISLSHLATIEIAHADHRKRAGVPRLAISEYSRADRLLQAAQEIGETLAATPFVVETVANRAELEWRRGRHSVALRHFDVAARQVELSYLALSDREQAETFFNEHAGLFDDAIECAAQAEKTRDVLRFIERGRARRLLRDVAEMAVGGRRVPDMYRSFFAILPPGATETASLPEAEKLLVTIVQPLRTRLLQGRPISTSERKALHDAQSRIQALGGTPVDTGPLRWEDLRAKIFEQAVPPLIAEPDEEIQELPGAGVLICRHCLVYNRIGSTFCSACEAIQTKTATFNIDATLGGGTEEEQKSVLADHLYNEAVRLINKDKTAEAEEFLDQAMRLASHPDYHFFHALCRLADADAASALADFHAIQGLRYAEKYPFWPLPVSPRDVDRAIEVLETDPMRTAQILGDLMGSYAALSARRVEAVA